MAANPTAPSPPRRPRGARPIAVGGLLLALLAVAASAFAQSAGTWDLSVHSTGSGGGTSAGAPYVIDGTIGQAVTGHSAGGAYAVDGGFYGGGAGSPPPPPAPTHWFLAYLATDGVS